MSNKTTKVPWCSPEVGDREHELIKQALDNNFLNEGKLTALFEEEICRLTGSKHALAVTNGTSAMFISLKALGIGHGDEVIVPDMTFIATANAVEMTGAKPVLADIDPKTLALDADALEQAITKKTKAVIPVHVSGRAADMGKIIDIAERNNIHIVEDAAEAFMSKHDGKFLGTFGKTGCFSFSPPKIITTGQGGVVITDDDGLYVHLREIKDQGRSKRGTGGDDTHHVVGYNFKFTDLQAAVGLGQLSYLKTRMEKTRRIYKLYCEGLRDLEGIRLFGFNVEEDELPLWTDAIVKKREEVDKYVASLGFECRRFWLPIHTQKPYRLPDDNFPNSIAMSKKALWLPSSYTLSEENIKAICANLRKFLKGLKPE